MKKKSFSNYPYWSSGCKKLLLTMKIGFILTLFCVIQLQASLYSQSTKFNLNFNNTPLREILREVENKSDFRFFYSDDLRFLNNKVTLKVNDSNVEQVLDILLANSHLTYKVFEDNLIIITPLEQPGQRKITGKVTDAQTGEPIPGANIVVEGTTIGTISSLNGEYSIEVPGSGSVLVISFIGYLTQKIPVNELTVIDVSLPVDFAKIEEVVVTALGLEKSKRTLTYATQQLDMDNITTLKEINLGNALAGKIAGLSVQTSSGSLGVAGDARIVLRGDRSINSNNQPLIVIDGVPVSDRPAAYSELVSRTIEGSASPGGYQMNSLSVVNPDDIESINVLKGPAASALYGSSAQNGVIVITTKKGTAGRSSFEINSSVNFDLPYMYPEFQNEYGQGNGGVFNANAEIFSWGPKMTGQTVTDWTDKQSKLEPQPNNVKDFFRTGQTYTNTISYSTGVDKATAYFSYSNTSALGLIETNNMQRHNFNLRVTSEVVKNLHADFKITYFNQKIEDDVDYGIDQFSTMYQLCIMPRSMRTSDLVNYSYYDDTRALLQNTWAPGSTSVNNPYWSMYAQETPSTTNRVNSFASLKYDFTDWLYLQVRAGLNLHYNDSEFKTWWGTQYIYSGKGDYKTAMNKGQSFTGDALLVFRKQLTNNLRLNANIGAELKDVYGRSMSSAAGGLTVENKFSLSYAQALTSGDGESRVQKQAVYGMANLSYRDYLFLDFTARNDWSSTLPPPFSYFYPSVGLTGIISDMIDLPDIFSYMKLRGSYAEVGNDAKYSMRVQTYGASAMGPVGFLSPSSTKVPVNLIPEMTKSWEAGGEIKILENRFGVDVTWYKSNTFNQLILVSSPPSSGFGSGWINCGNIQNTGIEVLLSATPMRSNDLRWDIDLNFSRNWNEVIELTETTTEYELSRGNLSVGSTKAVVGEPFGEIYTKGYMRDSVGNVIVDAQGLPQITSTYTHYLGNYNYDWRSGLMNSISYKNWYFTCLIDMNYGGVRQSITEAHLLQSGNSMETLEGRETGIIFDGVKADGSPNDIMITAEQYGRRVGGRITNGSGEPFTHDATNARLRELSVGYNFPIKSASIKSLRLSLVGRNLFFIYNACKWFDPDDAYEINVNGFGSESFSLPGTRSLGINLKVVL